MADAAKLRGKMAEKGYNIVKLSDELGINRNTMASYLKKPDKIPFGVIERICVIFELSHSDANVIFFGNKLR